MVMKKTISLNFLTGRIFPFLFEVKNWKSGAFRICETQFFRIGHELKIAEKELEKSSKWSTIFLP